MKILLALVLTASMVAAEEVTLEAKWTPGERCTVSEESLVDTKVKASVRGIDGDPSQMTRQSGKYKERKIREYEEEVLEASEAGTKIRRAYANSLKEVLKPSGKKESSERTALCGLTVTIARVGASQQVTSDLGPVEGDNASDATFVDQIYALLPDRPVAVGKGWEVSPEVLGRALFHEAYNPALMRVSGKAVLRDVSGKEGERVAKIALDWDVKLEKVDKIPGIAYRLTGIALFHVDRGRFLSLEASGPIEMDISEGGGRIELEGKMSLSYRAKPAK